jgi:hypothetical protein
MFFFFLFFGKMTTVIVQDQNLENDDWVPSDLQPPPDSRRETLLLHQTPPSIFGKFLILALLKHFYVLCLVAD